MRGGARHLLRLDRLRLRAAVRHPLAGGWLWAAIPVAILVGILWSAGVAAVPASEGSGGAASLGMLVSGAVSFLVYGVVFRGTDDHFLRRLGVPPRALYAERAARLLAATLGVSLLVLVPFLSSGEPLARPFAVALAAGAAAWGTGLAGYALVARAMALHERERGWGCLTAGMWDMELAAVAPLAYAPLPPFLLGALAAAWVGGGTAGYPLRLAPVLALSFLAALAGARPFAVAFPRFAPSASEMAFEPPAAVRAGEAPRRRGARRLLPRGAASVWLRDATVAGRRFAWAERAAWPVAILAVVALARWGDDPGTAPWVASAVVLVLLLQAAAIVGLGRMERAGRRWLDRSLGLRRSERFLGRWAWGWGLALWLLVPVSLAWGWWSGAGGAWAWLLVGAVTSGLAAAASVATAGRAP